LITHTRARGARGDIELGEENRPARAAGAALRLMAERW
jgi:hypothetical protein